MLRETVVIRWRRMVGNAAEIIPQDRPGINDPAAARIEPHLPEGQRFAADWVSRDDNEPQENAYSALHASDHHVHGIIVLVSLPASELEKALPPYAGFRSGQGFHVSTEALADACAGWLGGRSHDMAAERT